VKAQWYHSWLDTPVSKMFMDLVHCHGGAASFQIPSLETSLINHSSTFLRLHLKHGKWSPHYNLPLALLSLSLPPEFWPSFKTPKPFLHYIPTHDLDPVDFHGCI
jgi:hypothetical protein